LDDAVWLANFKLDQIQPFTSIFPDTIYACQDIQDDIRMGAKSTAILFSSWIRPLLIVIAACFIMLLATAGLFNGQGWPFFAISVGGTAIHIVWQFLTVDLRAPESCWRE
jgi:4-hydroxybenzoate polyprenyltransferase